MNFLLGISVVYPGRISRGVTLGRQCWKEGCAGGESWLLALFAALSTSGRFSNHGFVV